MSEKTYLCRHKEYTDDDDYRETLGFDVEDAAETHAEYIFNQCDGWEYMPNNTTIILVKNGDTVAEVGIYTEFYPSFSARSTTQRNGGE